MSKTKTIKTCNIIEPINKDKAALLSKISTLIENGRQEITTKGELEQFPLGSLISYMNTQGIFRTAGFIDKFEDESFIYLDIDFATRRRVQYIYIKKMWVGKVNETKNDIVSIIPSTAEKTKHFAKIGDIVVYYSNRPAMISRFKHTQKYQRMVKWYERYGNGE